MSSFISLNRKVYQTRNSVFQVITLQNTSRVKARKKFLACTRHQYLKSKNKAPPKFLSSSGMRGGKFIFVNNFSAQEHPSSKKQAHIKFQSYGGVWHKAMTVLFCSWEQNSRDGNPGIPE